MGLEGEAGIPGPRFSPKPEPKVTAERVINRVNEIAEKWTNSPEIEVVQSAKELGDDVDPDALGFIGEDGKVRIIAIIFKAKTIFLLFFIMRRWAIMVSIRSLEKV